MDSPGGMRYKGPYAFTGKSRMLRRLVIVAVLAGLVAGCGVRGPLEPPPGAKQDEEKKPDFVLDGLL